MLHNSSHMLPLLKQLSLLLTQPLLLLMFIRYYFILVLSLPFLRRLQLSLLLTLPLLMLMFLRLCFIPVLLLPFSRRLQLCLLLLKPLVLLMFLRLCFIIVTISTISKTPTAVTDINTAVAAANVSTAMLYTSNYCYHF